jgi:hypothetical protein
MKNRLVAVLLAIAVGVALPALAQTGNGAPSGPHYNLNIIGVEKGKTADMTDSQRHTIFVALGTKDQGVTSRIYLTPGEFRVCDGNAFDPALDCAGNPVGNGDGAVFQLPCNTNLSEDVLELVPCTVGESAAYEVWARALGSPNNNPYASMTTCYYDPALADKVCSTENVVKVRYRSKSTFTNVTNELTSLVADIDLDGANERVSLFGAGLVDWFWQYDNYGLKLMQLRFYPRQ